MSLLISLHFASITTFTSYSQSSGIKSLQAVKLVAREGLNPLLLRGNSYIIGCEMAASAPLIQMQQSKIIYQSLVTHLMSRDALMIVSSTSSHGNTTSLTYYVLVPPRANSLHGNILLLELIDYDLMLRIDEKVCVDFTSEDQVQRGDIDIAMENILAVMPYEVTCNSGIPKPISQLLVNRFDSKEVTVEMKSMSVTQSVRTPVVAVPTATQPIKIPTKRAINDEIEDDDI